MNTSRPTVAISGSFRRFYGEIKAAIAAFEALGIEVLSPKASEVINPGAEFVILQSDTTHDSKTLQQNHFDAIRKADALYLCNPEGYLGNSAVLELGYALALGKQVFCKETPTDATLKLFGGEMATPADIKEKFSQPKKAGCVPRTLRLNQFRMRTLDGTISGRDFIRIFLYLDPNSCTVTVSDDGVLSIWQEAQKSGFATGPDTWIEVT